MPRRKPARRPAPDVAARRTAPRDRATLTAAGGGRPRRARRRTADILREVEERYRSVFEESVDGLVITDPESGLVVDANPAMYRMHGYTREEFIGIHPSVFIDPRHHYLFREYIDTVRAGGTFQTQAVDLRKDGTPLSVEVHGSAISYQGRPHILGIVRDITERVHAYELLEQRVAERTRELSTLLEVSQALASTLELTPLLRAILAQLKIVVEYTGSSVVTLDGDTLTIVDSQGPNGPEDEQVGTQFRLQADHPVLAVLRRRQPLIVPDVMADTVYARAYREAVGERLSLPGFNYVRSWMAAPLVAKDRLLGMVSVSYREPNRFTEQHARLTMAIAGQAAAAIENARLYAQAQDLAVLEERQRLARELHDSVTQSLFSITLMTQALPRLLDRDLARARERLERVNELAQGALAEMRALIFQLRPETLEAEGLVVALGKLAEAVRARHGIAVTVVVGQEPDLPPDVRHALFRIAQEALNNTVKHARAHAVELRLKQQDGGVTLEVADDGGGFNPEGLFPGHLGLRSMRERAAEAGAQIEIDSAPGRGTRVRVLYQR